MSKTEQLAAVAERLSEEQVDALLSLAQSMAEEPFYDKAPPEALASLERGLEQIARGGTASLDELFKRLETRQAVGSMNVVLSPEAVERLEAQIAISATLERRPRRIAFAPEPCSFSPSTWPTFRGAAAG